MLNYTSRPKRILIAEDETTLLFFLRQVLSEEAPVFTVDAVSTGEDAKNRLAAHPYDLLVTDIKMPGISGLSLIEIARSLQPDIKIILMTAFNLQEFEQQFQTLQIEACLTKPFPTALLRTLAHQLLVDPGNLPEGSSPAH